MTWPASNRPGDFPAVLASSQTAARAVGGLVFAVGQAWVDAWAVDPALARTGRTLAAPEATVRLLQQVAHATVLRYREP